MTSREISRSRSASSIVGSCSAAASCSSARRLGGTARSLSSWAAEEVALEQIATGRDAYLEVLVGLDLLRHQPQAVWPERVGFACEALGAEREQVQLDDVHESQQPLEPGRVL